MLQRTDDYQTIPVRLLTSDDLHGEVSSAPPLGPWDKANRELWTKTDRSVYLNTPLCVQVVAPKMQERSLVNAMTIIDEALSDAKSGKEQSKARL
jgi:amidase